MTNSRTGKLSIIAVSLSIALAMLMGTASAAKKGPAKAKKDGARAKKDAPKPNRRKGAGQEARAKAIEALAAELAKELNLTDAQKTKAQQIIKKHMRTITAPKGKGPGQGKDKAPGAGKRGGGGKKPGNAGKPDDGPPVDRF